MQAAEYQCRNCKRIFSREEFNRDPHCPKCGVYILSHIPRKYWLFQFSPEIYDWNGFKNENNEVEHWLASQYSKRIFEGDAVAIWSSGKNAGIYAIGEIASYPRKRPLNPAQARFYVEKNNLEKFERKPSVMVKYSTFLEKPILQEECLQDEVLSSIQVFMNPQGTNFRLSRTQWDRITEKIYSNEAEEQLHLPD